MFRHQRRAHQPGRHPAFALRRKFPWRKLPGYWLAQTVGAFAAAAVVYAVYVAAINAFNQTNHIASRPQSLPTFSVFATFPAQYFNGSWVGPFVDQIVGTAMLLAVVAALLDRHLAFPGQGQYFTNYWWIPIAGPLIGAVVGIVAYDIFAGRALSHVPED